MATCDHRSTGRARASVVGCVQALALLAGCGGRPSFPAVQPSDAAPAEAEPAERPQDQPRTDNRPGAPPVDPPVDPPTDGPADLMRDRPSDRAREPPVDQPADIAFDAPPDAPPDLPPDAQPDTAENGYVHLISDVVTLLGSGPDSCSSGTAGPHVWCAVSTHAANTGTTELWVVDVDTAHGATTLADCAGASACLRLHGNLWDDPGFYSSVYHRFTGDTLIFYANGGSTSGGFEGLALAWRPGWSGPLELTGPRGRSCVATARTDNGGPYAYCYENVDDTMGLQHFDLTAGRISQTEGRFSTQDSLVDEPGAPKHSARFSPDNRAFVWSGHALASSPESFWWKTADALAQPSKSKLFDDGSSRLGFLGDGQHIFYLRGYDYAAMNGKGELVVDTLPPSGAPTSIHSSVKWARALDDGTISDRGLVYLADVVAGKGDLHVLRTASSPASDVLVMGGACEVLEVSKTLDRMLYAKTCSVSTQLYDLSLLTLDPMIGSALGDCTLTTAATANLFGIQALSDDGQWVFWSDNVDITIGVGDAELTRADSCTTSKLGTALWSWEWIAGGRVAWGQDSDGVTAALQVAPLSDPPLMTTSVQPGAGIAFSTTPPDYRHLVYTVQAGMPGTDGLWTYTLFYR